MRYVAYDPYDVLPYTSKTYNTIEEVMAWSIRHMEKDIYPAWADHIVKGRVNIFNIYRNGKFVGVIKRVKNDYYYTVTTVKDHNQIRNVYSVAKSGKLTKIA